MPPAVKGVNSAISSIPVSSAEGTGHLTTLTSNRCLFLEQMLVIWATQSIQERKQSPVSHQRKSVPKHKMQHATVRRKAESKTIFQHVSPSAALPDITVPRKSHPGVRGSPGCSPAAPYLPTPVLGSAGPEPGREERSGQKGAFQGGRGRAPSGGDRWVWGAGVVGAAQRSSTSSPPETSLTEAWGRGLPLLQGLGPGPKTSRQGPYRPRLAPAPGWLCRRAAPASPSGSRGGPGPVGEPGLGPSCLTASSRSRDPTPAIRVVPLLD